MKADPHDWFSRSRRNQGLSTLLLAALTGCSVPTPPAASSEQPRPPLQGQAVTWTSSTVQEVYNPSGDRYSYAPSVMVEGQTEHIWTCHNRDSGVIKDYIYYTKRVNGAVVSSVPVLEASAAGWDKVHVCDPSVVKANVTYNSTAYSYVMFYLGNDAECSCHNSIGVAVAQSVEGPWIKYPSPIVTFPFADTNLWGVGQPSATSVDGNGRFLLFYSEGDTEGRGYRRDINLSNLNSPSIGAAVRVTDAGLSRSDGATGQFTSFDVTYDPSRDRFYAVLEQYPFSNVYPNYITSNLQVVSIEGSSIWNGGGTWRAEGLLTPSTTGFDRNHNAGLKRTPSGTLPSANQLDVVFTKSCSRAGGASCPVGEWSYDLWEVSGTLNNAAAPTTPGFSGFYSMTNQFSGKALDIPFETVNTDGTKLQQYTYSGYAQQQWQLVDVGDGYHKIINRLSGKALDVPYETRLNNGTVIQQWTDSGGPQQQWKVEAVGSTFKLTNRLSGKVLDVPYEGYQNNATQIQQWSDLGSPQQRWSLVQVP
ncbi:hypothetical protein E7T06_20580 [Deinococcus sp. Arct2-2]|uniref:RICIN domain-containing protein n=1 Tax=Deinococcus sp. Arct2-2 TaxID=2568653 RepID=UPI0010A383B0|nr:RICIN domain-containing protein [Deinococcus sp. Arct2-2]THF66750.1 hypothetical protein E7T06_20580 [Deinococcus sp. Arct2-2]